MNGLEDRLRQIRDSLTTGLVERDVAVRLALIAALSGEHLLLVGPPGTAKSLVARRLRHAFADTSYFERLLTRFSVPEELFGPLSIKGLEEDRYERLTKSYLPTASIAFLDEIFKANSAILNALLTLLNEREFDNGDRRVRAPLTAVVGASNELPDGEELNALLDRFLLRLQVVPVSQEKFSDLLALRGSADPNVPEELRLKEEELADLCERAERVDVPDDVLTLLKDLREWCIAETIPVSDRRWRKVVKLLQTSALTNEREEVSIWDCWLLQHCLWSETQDKEKVFGWYASRVGAATDEPSKLIRVINAWEMKLSSDREDQSQLRDNKGNLLYMGEDGKPTLSRKGQMYYNGEAMFLAPEGAMQQKRNRQGYPSNELAERTNDGEGYSEKELDEMIIETEVSEDKFKEWTDKKAYLDDESNWIKTELKPAIGPTKHKTAHIERCLRRIQHLRKEVEQHKAGIERHIETFKNEIHGHLWVSEDFVEPASKGLGQRRDEAEKLLGRLAVLEKGYNELPREEEPKILMGTSEE